MTDGPPTVPIRGVVPHDAAHEIRASTAAPQNRRLGTAIAMGAAGVVLIIIGTFLPWVSSGGHGRNIYELTGLAGKLGLFDASPWRAVPILVPLLGPACIAPVVLAILRLRRTAGVAATVIGLLAAVLATATMLVGGRAADHRHSPRAGRTVGAADRGHPAVGRRGARPRRPGRIAIQRLLTPLGRSPGHGPGTGVLISSMPGPVVGNTGRRVCVMG